MCKQTWSSKSHDIFIKKISILPFQRVTLLNSYLLLNLYLLHKSPPQEYELTKYINIYFGFLTPFCFYVHGSMLPARELPCSLFNTQNDLFQIHIKIHIFGVFSRTNQFRIT